MKNMKNIMIIVVVIMIIFIIFFIANISKENYLSNSPVVNAINSSLKTSLLYTLTFNDNKLRSTVLIPRGTIVMWYGTGTEVPPGWKLCDGTLGTPNLVDKFIKGTSTISSVTEGGSKSYTMTVDQMPRHNHSVSSCSLGNAFTIPEYKDDSHDHQTNWTSGVKGHKTDVEGNHTHSYTATLTGQSIGIDTNQSVGEIWGIGGYASKPEDNRGTGYETHPAGGDHTHPPITTDPDGAHSHGCQATYTGTIGKTGKANPNPVSNEPSYYVLAFIMKL
jgi:hypothetical protein